MRRALLMGVPAGMLAAALAGPLAGTAAAASVPACPVNRNGVVTIAITDQGPAPVTCSLTTAVLVSFSNQTKLPVHIQPADPATWPKPDPSTPDPLPPGAATVPVRFAVGSHAYTEQGQLAGVPVGPANPGSLRVTAAPTPAATSSAPSPSSGAGSGGASAGTSPPAGAGSAPRVSHSADVSGLAGALSPTADAPASPAGAAPNPLVAGTPAPQALGSPDLSGVLDAPGVDRQPSVHRASSLFQGSPGRPFGLPAAVAAVLLLGVGFALARVILTLVPAGVPGEDTRRRP